MPDATNNIRRVLVVDDTPETTLYLTRVLRKQGFEVAEASDGEACLQQVRQWLPDLVILDIMLPKLHGMDVLKQILGEPWGKPIGVIVCSARSYKPDIDQALERGAFAFLTKPLQLKELTEKVKAYFERSQTSQAPAAAEARAMLGATPTEIYLPKLDVANGYWRVWGTRGSIPTPGTQYLRHGGNTSCFEVRHGVDHVIIDAGTGILGIGQEIAASAQRTITLLVGHTHWDHISGFPFFAPAFIPGFEIDIYGASGFGKDLKSIFSGQLDRDYFPVAMEDMAAQLRFHALTENPLRIGNIVIHWEFVIHPGATVGFRIEVAGKKIVYISDNEFLKGYFGRPHDVKLDEPMMEPFRKLVQFCEGADVLIHEAQYPNEEYVKKVGWGHSSVSNACLLAKFAGVKRWIITHHDPAHDDAFLLKKLNLTRQIMRSLDSGIEVTHAYDGMMELL